MTSETFVHATRPLFLCASPLVQIQWCSKRLSYYGGYLELRARCDKARHTNTSALGYTVFLYAVVNMAFSIRETRRFCPLSNHECFYFRALITRDPHCPAPVFNRLLRSWKRPETVLLSVVVTMAFSIRETSRFWPLSNPDCSYLRALLNRNPHCPAPVVYRLLVRSWKRPET